MKMTLRPGEKRTRRPTVVRLPATPTTRKAPTKKKTNTPKTSRRAAPKTPRRAANAPPLQAQAELQQRMNQLLEGVALKSVRTQEVKNTAHYELSQFPEVAHYSACHGANGTPNNDITFCKMARCTGIIHLEAGAVRKKASSTDNLLVSGKIFFVFSQSKVFSF